MSDLFPVSPPVRILMRMKEIAEAAKLGTTLGLEKEFTVRHFRGRKADYTERPSLGIRWMLSDRDEEEQSAHTHSEICWRMEVDLVVDMNLPAEDEDADDPSARADLTGWDHLTAAAAMFANLFLDPDGPFIGFVDDCIPGRLDPDEDSKPDQGRLAIALIVLYRTSATDQMRLLTAEMNA